MIIAGFDDKAGLFLKQEKKEIK